MKTYKIKAEKVKYKNKYITIQEFIKIALAEKDLSIDKLCIKHPDIKRDAVFRFLAGKQEIGAITFCRILAALDICLAAG